MPIEDLQLVPVPLVPGRGTGGGERYLASVTSNFRIVSTEVL